MEFFLKRKFDELESDQVKPTRVLNGEKAFEYGGFPAFRIALGKYVYVNKTITGVNIDFGEWDDKTGSHVRSTKNISLDVAQYVRLCGLILSGKCDLSDAQQQSSQEYGRLTPMFHLGNQVYFSWSRWNRSNLATVRYYRPNASGDLVPTKNGLTFGHQAFFALKKMIKDMVGFVSLLT